MNLEIKAVIEKLIWIHRGGKICIARCTDEIRAYSIPEATIGIKAQNRYNK
jgi:hypothetical protein